MAKIAFIVPPMDGHLNPTLSIGRELLRREHEVCWIGIKFNDFENKLPAGAVCLGIDHTLSDEEMDALKKRISAMTLTGIESLKSLYEGQLVPVNRLVLPHLIRHLTDFKPDLVVYDQQMFAGAVAAEMLHLPYVASVTAPSSLKTMAALPKLHEWEEQQIIQFQKACHIPVDYKLEKRALAVLVYTSRAFFGNNPLPQNYKFIGPVLANRPTRYHFDWERFQNLGRFPRILVSIGTTFDEYFNVFSFYKKVIDALKDQPVGVVMIADPVLFDEIPDNFIIQKRIPQLEVLPYLNAVVTHAGQNTVSEALSLAIPLVTIPIAYDQSQVAQSVVDSGAGIRLKFSRFRPEELRQAVFEVLHNPKYVEGARNIQRSFAECGGVEATANCLEELIKAYVMPCQFIN